MPSFEPISDSKLHELADEQLVTYLCDARDADRAVEVRRAAGVLLFRDQSRISRKVGLKVPPRAVEDLVAVIMMGVLETAISGSSIGEFRSLVNTIAQRRVADYTEARRRRAEHEQNLGSDDEDGADPLDNLKAPDEGGQIETDELLDTVLDGLSDVHRRIVELGGKGHDRLEGRRAREVCEVIQGELETEISEANVHQVLSRFRVEMRKLIQASGGPDV